MDKNCVIISSVSQNGNLLIKICLIHLLLDSALQWGANIGLGSILILDRQALRLYLQIEPFHLLHTAHHRYCNIQHCTHYCSPQPTTPSHKSHVVGCTRLSPRSLTNIFGYCSYHPNSLCGNNSLH